ncbi:tumor necrosis factor receptor superfamily member 18 isoform X3 [Canis lupus dingo]|uniref:tumor necrosis factor receptor superfamily member 18 isoform X3 n=1 Tax=Canis lupus dingo TaxID=286419 RepID=UPI000BAA2FDC|nr:tumor necrosis factor receptor superfamily member 18 isoform X3 [Canis lupus dingo]|eukprot:XP_022273765.1 tumor necrosis factor receptor superfamily member 18 isoform X2 [Canis lupus familiaris]
MGARRAGLCGVVLLCALGLGRPGAPSCGPGRLLRGTGTDARCCRPCAPGEAGNFNFGFECVDCAAGTFSGGQEGRCKPWSDCSQFGYPTTFPGNKTHNAVCSPGLPPTEPRDPLTIVLLTVATCILVLSGTQLVLHIWQLRGHRRWPPETQLLLETRPPAEDTCSCQFPEEERGEQLSPDKGQLRDLWV